MMKKCLLILFGLIIVFNVKADFGIWASAIYLNVNGTSNFYNNQKSSTLGNIGSGSFSGTLGVFGLNSGTLKIAGAEIRTFKETGSNLCGGSLFYTVYPLGNRPVSPVFSIITLSVFCNCNGTSFSSCGGGTCSSTSEQKLQNVSKSVDLTTYDAGDYTLEVYYQVNGENSGSACSQNRVDNAGGSNYRANFTISDPLSVSISSFTGVCTDNAIKVKWTMQNESDISKYEIEKSQNGLTFSPIGTVNSGRSATEINYSFYDNNPVIGTNYYRIKIYHLNTAVSLSDVRRIYFGKVGNTLFIYPNPSGTELTIRFAAVDRGNYQMSVMNNNGQRILTLPVVHDGTDKTMRINMPATLSRGLYRLFLIDKNQFFKQSFLIR